MGLVRFQPEPSGGRYMLEMFECTSCDDCCLRVRPIRYAEASQVYQFSELMSRKTG